MVVRGVLKSPFALLFPHLSGVRIDGVDADGGTIRLDTQIAAESATCPDCGGVSDRVRSRYRRQIADHSIGRRAVCIRVKVRRFRCPARECPRRIFAE
ncbi:transposase family protein [Nocardia sp. NPDC050630]|uniref:transposase family protein n=1 Tax=Nocardia sp. NPDC050630 TaxID=3364321 RepID=UPI00378C7F9C